MPPKKIRMTKQAATLLRNVKNTLRTSAQQVSQTTPLRFRQNVRRTRKSTRYNKASYGVVERKLAPFLARNEVAPNAINLGAQAYIYQANFGSTTPSTWTGTWDVLNGFTYPQGTGNNARDGRYMYLDKSTVNMSVHMNASDRLYSPTQFRMIVFRARRASTPTGISYDPNETLFLRPNGDRFGAGGGGVNFNDLYLQPTNKRDWIIVSDRKFTLSSFLQDGTTNTAAWQGKYPNFKTNRIQLTHKKKTSFQNTTNEPEDYDYHYGIIIIAGSVGRDQVANNWEINLRGTTVAIDS